MTNKFATVLAAAFAAVIVSCASAPPVATEPVADVTSAEVPEPFWDFDPGSSYTINYGDVDAILRTMVVDVGRSDREKLPPLKASTGTRLQAKVRRTTGSEGNRFYFESFKDNEEYRQLLRDVRRNLEQIPSQIPLRQFSREEQLAYWLNLYNITVLDQLVQIYPERNLKGEIVGRNTFFGEKILNVEGIPLSLDDIQHTILRWNYDDNPLVIYGLYQGNIGGPNIRRWAYTGESVYRDLIDNAEEFINSNRGTYYRGGDVFHVSSFYDRNRGYFANFETDLKEHLMRYIEGAQRDQLQQTERLAADIDDWTLADVDSGEQRIAGSFASNQAAMLNSVSSTQPGEDPGTSVPTNFTAAAISGITESQDFKRFRRTDLSDAPRIEIKPDRAETGADAADDEDDDGARGDDS